LGVQVLALIDKETRELTEKALEMISDTFLSDMDTPPDP